MVEARVINSVHNMSICQLLAVGRQNFQTASKKEAYSRSCGPLLNFGCLYRIFKTDEAIRIPNFGIQIDRGEH